MNRDAWSIFAGIAAALALGLVGTRAWQQHQQLRAAQVRLQEMAQAADLNARRAAEIEERLATVRHEADALAERMASATNTQHQLQAGMRAALQSRDVAISELQGRLTVNIVDRILFDSGEASLKPEGMKVLDQVAGVLSGFTDRQIQVYGHTDNVPIRLKFASNWELSTARALAAVRYLSEKAGVDPRRISAVGCGEHQPIADNTTPEGRALNRRIALVVLPEQFVPTDVTTPATNTPANTAAGTDATAETQPQRAAPGAGGLPPALPAAIPPNPSPATETRPETTEAGKETIPPPVGPPPTVHPPGDAPPPALGGAPTSAPAAAPAAPTNSPTNPPAEPKTDLP